MITFGLIVKLTQDFVTIDQFTPPTLEVSGITPMGAAIEYALDFLENRKQTYNRLSALQRVIRVDFQGLENNG